MTIESTPVPNLPLLRKVVELAEAEVEAAGGDKDARAAGKWNQSSWVRTEPNSPTERFYGYEVLTERATTCGTTGCIAGHAVMLSGDRIIGGGFSVRLAECVTPEGVEYGIGDRAEKLLGLTPDQANELFYWQNTIADVRTAAESIAASVGERL